MHFYYLVRVQLVVLGTCIDPVIETYLEVDSLISCNTLYTSLEAKSIMSS